MDFIFLFYFFKSWLKRWLNNPACFVTLRPSIFNTCYFQHSGSHSCGQSFHFTSVVFTATSQQRGRRFNSMSGCFLCRVCMFLLSPSFVPDSPASSHTRKRAREVRRQLYNCLSVWMWVLLVVCLYSCVSMTVFHSIKVIFLKSTRYMQVFPLNGVKRNSRIISSSDICENYVYVTLAFLCSQQWLLYFPLFDFLLKKNNNPVSFFVGA